MAAIFSSLNELISQDPIFWCCALTGTCLFVIQFLLTFLGGGDGDFDSGGGEVDASNLKWLSKQAMTGFLMMFGWVGLTCKKEFHLALFPTIVFAFLAGLLAIFVTALLFRGVRKLRSSGTVFRIEDAVGREATVYQRIPKGGVGKITLSLHDLTHEIDAISQLEEDLPSFTQVQVLNTSDATTVVVVPIK